MENKILFKEKQWFRQWWLVFILIVFNGFFLYALYQQIVKNIPIGENPISNKLLLILAVLSFILTYLILRTRLETRIQTDGIFVRFFPFHRSFKHYKWEEIREVNIRKYDPISEYGGWGYRIGVPGKGKALNVSGDVGLQITFRNDKKLLIGTKKPEQLEAILKKVEHLIGQQ